MRRVTSEESRRKTGWARARRKAQSVVRDLDRVVVMPGPCENRACQLCARCLVRNLTQYYMGKIVTLPCPGDAALKIRWRGRSA